MDRQRFLDIPSLKTIGVASLIIIAFLGAAYGLYHFNGGKPEQYWLKVGDALINGSIVGILFAILKAMFDLPKWLQERQAAKTRFPQRANNC